MRTRKQPLGTRNIVGAFIKKLRQDNNIRQKDLLAQLQVRGIDLNASGLSKIEGQIRHVTDIELLAITEVLHISADKLIGRNR